MTEIPQDILTKAAQLLRERAQLATGGPWKYEAGEISSSSEPVVEWTFDNNGPWIALMSPDLAPHIAAWLERSAEDYRSEAKAQSKWPPGGYTMLLPDDFAAAVQFAELILGGAE